VSLERAAATGTGPILRSSPWAGARLGCDHGLGGYAPRLLAGGMDPVQSQRSAGFWQPREDRDCTICGFFASAPGKSILIVEVRVRLDRRTASNLPITRSRPGTQGLRDGFSRGLDVGGTWNARLGPSLPPRSRWAREEREGRRVEAGPRTGVPREVSASTASSARASSNPASAWPSSSSTGSLLPTRRSSPVDVGTRYVTGPFPGSGRPPGSLDASVSICGDLVVEAARAQLRPEGPVAQVAQARDL